MNNLFDIVALIGGIVRVIGLLVFGVSAGWFTLYAFRQPEQSWQLQIAVYLGIFFFTSLLSRFSSPAGVGGFALGLGGALLFWGLRDEISDEEETPPEED